jgi:hypothetical protein
MFIRALPIGVAVTAVAFIVLTHLDFQKKKLRYGFAIIWSCLLILAAIWCLVFNHIGFCITIALTIMSTWTYYLLPDDKATMTSPGSLLHWAITLVVATLIIGFISGSAWQAEGRFIPWLPRSLAEKLPTLPATVVHKKGDTEDHIGHVIFAGTSGILFLEYELANTESNKGIQFFQLKNITEIYACRELRNQFQSPSSSDKCLKAITNTK